MTHLERIAETNRVPLAKQIPCILLCLQLPPPVPESSAASILNRFALFNIPVRGRAPHVNAIFAAIILHLLPRPYATARTINLILVVITIACIRIADKDTHNVARQDWLPASVPRWVLKQNEEVGTFLAGLPRWIQALLPTTYNIDLSEIVDEIARRLPPADEGLAGDYIEALASKAGAEGGTEREYSVLLRDVYGKSKRNAVTPAEILMLIPKLLAFTAKLSRRRFSAQAPQNMPLHHFSPPVNHETLYSNFACTALRGALLNLSLLRHTDKIVAVRELTVHEWLFITCIATGREKAWAPTAYTAMRTAARIAEERRRVEVERSGKHERDVSLFGSMGVKERLMVLTQYATGMSELRFDQDLFSAAVECTEPLMREYLRALEADTIPSLRALDTKYRIRQMLSVVTRVDNLNESEVVEESGDGAEDEEMEGDPSRVEKTNATAGKATLSLLRALEKFLDAPAPPVPAKNRSGFVKGDFPDQGNEARIASECNFNEDFIMRLHVVESAIVYCLYRFKNLGNCRSASSELVQLAMRSTRRMQHIIGVHLRYISSVVQGSARDSRPVGVTGNISSGTQAKTAMVEGVRGENKTLQLSWITVRLQVELAARKDLSPAEHADLVAVAAELMADLTTFMDSIRDHHVLPDSFNRNIAILHRFYSVHKRILKSSTAAADVPPFQAAEENVRKLVVACFGVLQRVLPTRHHQRRLAAAASASSSGFYTRLVMAQTFDSALSLALAANMTLDELPNISDVMEKTIDTIRDASQMSPQVTSSDIQRPEAERQLRNSLLPKLLHFLHHICTLSVNSEACLSAAAAAVGECAKEDKIAPLSWRKRESILSMTSYVYRVLSDRFAHSRASRDVGHQLLIMVSRLALDRLEFKDPAPVGPGKQGQSSGREVQLRRLVCATLIWQISCVVASTLLQNAPMDKYLGVMQSYVKRNFVISMSTQATGGESCTPSTEAELEYCERVLLEADVSRRSCVQWELTTTKEEVIARCNFAMSEVFFALKFLTNPLYTESSGSSSQAFRARWISQTEVACGLLKRYQRWVAPSVWRSVWRELVAATIVIRVGHFNSVLVQETTEVAAQRLLLFSKVRDNKGEWIYCRARPAAVSPEDGGAKEISVVKKDPTAESRLLSFVEVSRMFELQDQFTDMELRVYLTQLMDRLSEEKEECKLASVDIGSGLEEERVGRSNGLSETHTEKDQRQLRTARNNILFTCRRMRS
ncbi:hypothetical protein JKF63_00832 [Porcisia hertigi]|uniref:Uncharacterized protein n=1 Tax=Porcisia hertigi TaxID=2761500 RepID=A0A836HU90_9TRYP|nr:hypothetical protein JKF63_00832 [Porcisia hertigi]